VISIYTDLLDPVEWMNKEHQVALYYCMHLIDFGMADTKMKEVEVEAEHKMRMWNKPDIRLLGSKTHPRW
jgi:hypothetical protein